MTDAELFVICGFQDIPSRRAQSFHLVKLTPEGARTPWPVVVVRWGRHVFGYVNQCPHGRSKLDWERNQFFDGSGQRLMCGKHGATFDLTTGEGIDGPCRGLSLTPIALAVLDGDICVIGERLAEEEEIVDED